MLHPRTFLPLVCTMSKDSRIARDDNVYCHAKKKKRDYLHKSGGNANNS